MPKIGKRVRRSFDREHLIEAQTQWQRKQSYTSVKIERGAPLAVIDCGLYQFINEKTIRLKKGASADAKVMIAHAILQGVWADRLSGLTMHRAHGGELARLVLHG